jgi:Holliday junction resolvase RusA-like endonuclease
MNDDIQIIEQISYDSSSDDGGQLFLIPPRLPNPPPEAAAAPPIQEEARNAGDFEVIDLLSSCDDSFSDADSSEDDSTAGPVAKPPSKKKAKKGPRFSFNEADACSVGTGTFRFTIRGKPCVLERPRFTSRVSRLASHVFSPSGKYKTDFRKACADIFTHHSVVAGSIPIEEHVKVCIVIRERRPMNDFIGQGRSGRSFNRLRALARRLLGKGHGDVDNYAKFVLDALEGICYENDKQVALLTAVRVLDNDGKCFGAVDVVVKKFSERDCRYECEAMLEM